MTDVLDKPTTSPISTRKHGDVLIVTSNNPPVNALGHAVRQGLVAAIEEAEADDSVKAVVIACEGQTFFAGADVSRIRHAQGVRAADAAAGRRPDREIAPSRWSPRSTAPRSAAGSRSRSAAIIGSRCRSAKLGVPEVKLGLLPGAGGTQRLPRVAGVEQALEMAATGNPITRQARVRCGLVDRLIEGELLPHAVAYAEEVRDVRPLPKSSERQDKVDDVDPAVFDEFRKANARKLRGLRRAAKQYRGGRGGDPEALCRRRRSTSAGCSWS